MPERASLVKNVDTNTITAEMLRDSPILQKMSTNLISNTKMQIRVCKIFTSIPFEWDSTQGCIVVLKSKWGRTFCQFQVVFHYIYVLSMLGYFLSPWSMGLNSTSNQLLGFVFLSCLIVTMFMRSEFWSKRNQAVLLWKSFWEFERKYMDESAIQKTKKDKESLFMMLLGVCTSFGLPAFMTMMLIVDPCKPPHLGYMLYKVSLTKCLRPPFPIRVALLLLDAWIWVISIAPACFYVFHCLFLWIRCLDLYLRLLQSAIKRPLISSFSNQEAKDRLCFRLYHELQLMTKLYNKVFQAVFLPALTATAIFVIIICFYACVKLHKVIPMPGFAFFPLLSTDGFSVIFIARIASGVYIKSKKFVTIMQKSGRCSKRGWLRKKSKSLEILKIKFGSGNFIDELTPLIFLAFAFEKTVSLMLLTG